MKVHIGCGTVYLKDWLNVDRPSDRTFLAKDRPDLVERYITTEDRYYARKQEMTIDRFREGPLRQEYVCDAFGSFEHAPVEDGTVDEILSRQVFEHLYIHQARIALERAHWLLKPEGRLRIDIPNGDESLWLFWKTGDPFYKRHAFGPHNDHQPYTKAFLTALVEDYGFKYECEESNIHFYPAFCLRFRKV